LKNPLRTARACFAGEHAASLLAGILLVPTMGVAAVPCDEVFASGFESGTLSASAALCDAKGMNDTGVTGCGGIDFGNSMECSSELPPGQDALYGRDALAAQGLLSKRGAGDAGFDFTKISNAGGDLPEDAGYGTGANQWACTRDNVTGLVWEIKSPNFGSDQYYNARYTWYDPESPGSVGYDSAGVETCFDALQGLDCNTSNYLQHIQAKRLCGRTDWRMPSIRELSNVTHFSQHHLIKAFPERFLSPAGDFPVIIWASEAYVGSNVSAWTIRTNSGNSNIDLHRYAEGVMLVAGEAAAPASDAGFCAAGFLPSTPTSRFDLYPDGTATDQSTGLMWKRCTEGQTWSGSSCTGSGTRVAWAAALEQAEQSTYAGYSDWRLPNVKELRSIVEECANRPAINTEVFPNASLTQDSYLWSSTTSAYDGDLDGGAWYVQFLDGFSSRDGRDFPYAFRLVRDAR